MSARKKSRVPRPKRRDEPTTASLRRQLAQRCEMDARGIVHRGLATQADVEAMRPGGTKNPDVGVWAWIAFSNALVRWYALGEVRDGRLVKPDERQDPSSASLSGEDELLAMLGADGETVDLQVPIRGDVELDAITVYPKSLQALHELDAYDRESKWLTTRVCVLEDAADEGVATADDLELIRRGRDRLLEITALMIWVLSHPGGQCPYDPAVMLRPAPPTHLLAIDTLDVARILLVHRRVNGTRLATLNGLLPRGSTSRQPAQWSVFIAATARETHADTEDLVKRWPLQKILATAVLAAKSRLDAEREAKAAAASTGRAR